MADYWFKPKPHGYGATPTSWKGWALLAAYIGAAWLISLPLVVWPMQAKTGPGGNEMLIWIIAMVALTAAMLWITKIKTDGAWKWRWGSNN